MLTLGNEYTNIIAYKVKKIKNFFKHSIKRLQKNSFNKLKFPFFFSLIFMFGQGCLYICFRVGLSL